MKYTIFALACLSYAALAVPVEIPEPFVWNESFKVGNKNIDDEHKLLFKYISYFEDALADEVKLDTLKQKTIDHLDNEEGIVKKANFNVTDAQSIIDSEYLVKLRFNKI